MLRDLNLRVLMVEDNPGDQYLLKELLRSSGLQIEEVVPVQTLEDALFQLNKTEFDIILLDLSLSDSSGISTFHSLHRVASHIPIVILSGMRDMKLAVDAITHGAQDYLIKGDFDEKMLSKTIIYGIERMNNLQALQESNERYNLVSKATNDMVWDWDLSTGLIFRNEEGWKKIFQTPLESESGTEEDWEAMIHPEDLEKLRMAKTRICNEPGKEFFEIECRVKRKDGSYAWILDRGYVVRNPEGKPARLIGASQDITEKKRAEQQLKEEQLRRQREITDAVILAQENERRKIGAELHDNVNQILACTLLYMNMAKKDGHDKEFLSAKSEEMINSAIGEIRKLSHSLIPPSLNGENLSEALGRVIEPAQKSGLLEVEKDLQLTEETSIPEKLKLTIYRIAQEQMNNILKYAEAKKVTLKLLQEAGELLLIIKDDGIGFDTTQKSKGVGLLNMRTRAYLHNGIIRIVSSPGNGCTLYATFPVVKEVVETLPEPAEKHEARNAEGIPSGGER
jgi:two-component system, NarL family, sensor histidine kinase UhpB